MIAPISMEFAPSQGVQKALPDGEAELLEACRCGNRDAQRQLYQQHCDSVYRLMFRMAGSSHADDLTQQVFLAIFQRLEKFQGRSLFSSWLYRVASNEALQFLRRKRRATHQSIVVDPADPMPDAEDQLDQHDLLEYALGRLTPELRAIFLLRESEGLSYYEIAMAMDIAEGTVASRLNRARRCLRGFVSAAS